MWSERLNKEDIKFKFKFIVFRSQNHIVALEGITSCTVVQKNFKPWQPQVRNPLSGMDRCAVDATSTKNININFSNIQYEDVLQVLKKTTTKKTLTQDLHQESGPSASGPWAVGLMWSLLLVLVNTWAAAFWTSCREYNNFFWQPNKTELQSSSREEINAWTNFSASLWYRKFLTLMMCRW